MKLIIQIPCFNEAGTLPETLLALPRHIEGIDTIETLVIDDGSADDTANVARRFGVTHIERHRRNRGLAAAFRTGLARAMREGADIVVNTDADNQYDARDIEALVAPILAEKADLVIGDRGVGDNVHFGPFKRLLQRLGSATVRKLSDTDIPDAVSGFRAISREAAQRINVTATFSYTTETLIQAGRRRMAVTSVPVRTNRVERPSRLFKSIPHFMMNTGATMVRAYAMYNPLRTFMLVGAVATLIGLAPILRFLALYARGDGTGHIQSLVIGGALIVLGAVAMMLGAVADLIGGNRILLEHTLERLRAMEDRFPSEAVAPSRSAEEKPRLVMREAG